MVLTLYSLRLDQQLIQKRLSRIPTWQCLLEPSHVDPEWRERTCSMRMLRFSRLRVRLLIRSLRKTSKYLSWVTPLILTL
jgi:hypothetical protein